MNRIETSPTLDDSAAIAKLHARTAQRASVTYTAATLIIALMSLESAITSRTSDWQPFAAALVAISLSVTGGVAFRQIRRGSYLRGAHLIIGSFLMGLILFTTLHTGFGLVIALSGIAITVGIGGQTLPARQVGRTVVLAVLDAAIIILIDLYWPFYRSPAPRVFLQFIPVVGVVVIIYFVYTLIRQFQSYPLQTKLLLAFFLVALVPLGILTESNDNATRLALTSSANQALSAAAAQTADSIDNFFASNIADRKSVV